MNASTADDNAFDEIVAREDVRTRLAKEYDGELLSRAMALVARRVRTHTWEAFRLQAIEQLEVAEVARRLNMRIGTAYQAKSHVQRLLRETIKELSPEDAY